MGEAPLGRHHPFKFTSAVPLLGITVKLQTPAPFGEGPVPQLP